MRRASAWPTVIAKTVGSPLRSSRALVATVVPILTASMLAPTGSRARTPATAASAYCSGFSESSLWVTSEPSGRRATMSVKVPPRSIQNSQPRSVMKVLRSSRTSFGGRTRSHQGRAGRFRSKNVEQVQQQDDRQRDAQQPKECAFHVVLLNAGRHDADAPMPNGMARAQATAGDGADGAKDHCAHAPPGQAGGGVGGGFGC
jgi:hypothetical protein